MVPNHAFQRQRYIMKRLAADGAVNTLDLARALHVSDETIRRDLVSLEKQNLLKRVYGGAVTPGRKAVTEPIYANRRFLHADQKQALAQVAASLIQDEMSVFIDVGTTGEALTAALAPSFSGTIVSHSLLVAQTLPPHSQASLIMAPGLLRRGEWSLGGVSTSSFLSKIHFDIAFLSCGGIDADGATDFDMNDVEVKREVAGHSAKAFIIADSSKHHRTGTFEIANWGELAGLVTDSEPPGGIRQSIEKTAGKVLIPSPLS